MGPETVLDHLGFAVSEGAEGQAAGFGRDGWASFWIEAQGRPVQGRLHVAFRADSRETVDAFHAAALAAGGTDNGAPGLRTIYHPDYYSAYVRDPDGNNIELVCAAATA